MTTARGPEPVKLPSYLFEAERKRKEVEKRARPAGLKPQRPANISRDSNLKPEKGSGDVQKPPHELKFFGYDEFMAIDWGCLEWHVDHLIPRRGCGFLAAAPKSGKTWLSLDLALAIASGRPFLGKETKTGVAAYIGGEGGAGRLQQRLTWLASGRKLRNHALFAERLFITLNTELRLNTKRGMSDLRRELDSIQPTLLILDPFSRFHSCRENERDSMEPLLSDITKLSEDYQAFILIVHHAPKPGKEGNFYDPLRGSSALRGWHDALLWLEQPDSDSKILQAELRDAEIPDPLELTLDINETLGIASVGIQAIDEDLPDEKLVASILSHLSQHEQSTVNDLRTSLGKKKVTVAKAVAWMESESMVVREQGSVARKDGIAYQTTVIKLRTS
ncbi:MAG: AAA family ATPase [Planctomycetota bacterium]